MATRLNDFKKIDKQINSVQKCENRTKNTMKKDIENGAKKDENAAKKATKEKKNVY